MELNSLHLTFNIIWVLGLLSKDDFREDKQNLNFLIVKMIRKSHILLVYLQKFVLGILSIDQFKSIFIGFYLYWVGVHFWKAFW